MNDSESDIIAQSLRIIQDYLPRRRKYASHREWPDKRIKEKYVIIDLCESMQQAGEEIPHSLAVSPEDPPDCIAEDLNGNRMGIEVTELVYERAVRLNEKERKVVVHAYWTPEDVAKEVESKIRDKDSKTYKGGPYSRIWLVIYTDEGTITHRGMSRFLDTHLFVPTKQITDAFLLFSFDPQTKRYPYMRLKIGEKQI